MLVIDRRSDVAKKMTPASCAAISSGNSKGISWYAIAIVSQVLEKVVGLQFPDRNADYREYG
jgi:hypothetical protein